MLATQTAAFATISARATGHATTLFSALRQLSAASGIAMLTTLSGWPEQPT